MLTIVEFADITVILTTNQVVSQLLEIGFVSLFPAAALLGTYWLLRIGYGHFRRRQVIERLGTTPAAEVTMGLNQLKGTAVAPESIQSYLSEEDVVYYEYSILERYKKRVRRDGETRTVRRWKVVDSGGGDSPFELHDDSGSVRVNPSGANIVTEKVVDKTCGKDDPMYYGKGPSENVSRSLGVRRFEETIIRPGEQLYVLGAARVREDSPELEIGDRHFGYSGGIDLVISTKGETGTSKKYGWKSLRYFLGAVLLGAIGFVVLPWPVIMAGFEETFLYHSFGVNTAVGAGAVLLVIAGMYAKIVYDGMAGFQECNDQAWRLLEQEYCSRARLICDLVDFLQERVSEHHHRIAAVRGRIPRVGHIHFDATGPEEAAEVIDEQTRVLDELFDIVEEHPELKTDNHIVKLTEKLAMCEEKISRTRELYNRSVKQVNRRTEQLSDSIFSPLAGDDDERLEFEPFEVEPLDEKQPVDDAESASSEVVESEAVGSHQP